MAESVHQQPGRHCLRCGLTLATRAQRKFCSSTCANIYRCRGVAPTNANSEDDIRRFLWETKIRKIEGGCWEWVGYRPGGKYGHVGYKGETWLTHRLSFFLFTGIHPGDKMVLHSCDNPPCVNPAHLSLGTGQDNSDDMVAKGRSCKGRLRPGTGPAGERNCKAKLTADAVCRVRAEYEGGGVTLRELASRYGISKSQAHNIVSGAQWKEFS